MARESQPAIVAGALPDRRIEEPEQSDTEKIEVFVEGSGPLHTAEEPRPEQSQPKEEIPQGTNIVERKGPKDRPGEDYADNRVKNKFARYVLAIVILAFGYFIYTNLSTPSAPIKPDRRISKTSSTSKKKLLRSKASLPTPDNPFIKQAINDFVKGYLRDSGSENPDAILIYYNDKVNYYAKGWVEKKFIYGDKKAYFNRWPHRTYELVSDIEIQDSNKDSSKVVQFTYEFHVWNDNKTIKGQARNILKLKFYNNMWHIIDEKGNVITREIS